VLNLNIGYSPCPNDTYIFAGLAGETIDTPLWFDPVLADVETLNQWAMEQKLEVTKLSFLALGKVRNAYGLLYAGAALGRGCGPIVVARPGTDLSSLETGAVAAPGRLTTACLLLGLYLGKEPQLSQMLFSEVMPAVARGDADFGLVIHEGRFTYEQYGLQVLFDLGAWWEGETGKPIPLGGIAVRRDLGFEVARMVDHAIHASLLSARMDPQAAMKYMTKHAQEMNPEVLRQHVELYVNAFTCDLGTEGEEAVSTLFGMAEARGLIPTSPLPLMAY
jgi:1,4-dihydroxy-6-naphthoate synthase